LKDRKEEFSVIILGLDGAGKTVCQKPETAIRQDVLTFGT
jgi:hypothetical protein